MCLCVFVCVSIFPHRLYFPNLENLFPPALPEAALQPLISLHVSPQVHAHSVLSCGRCFDEEQVLFPFLSHALSCLWADQGVRAAVARGFEYELNDSAL